MERMERHQRQSWREFAPKGGDGACDESTLREGESLLESALKKQEWRPVAKLVATKEFQPPESP